MHRLNWWIDKTHFEVLLKFGTMMNQANTFRIDCTQAKQIKFTRNNSRPETQTFVCQINKFVSCTIILCLFQCLSCPIRPIQWFILVLRTYHPHDLRAYSHRFGAFRTSTHDLSRHSGTDFLSWSGWSLFRHDYYAMIPFHGGCSSILKVFWNF
jgi:hypothetical protein